jgi:hypothetical protein
VAEYGVGGGAFPAVPERAILNSTILPI